MVLLSVAMHGIKTFVVTQNPKSMEQLRQTAVLANNFNRLKLVL
jgi:hypothetical protein